MAPPNSSSAPSSTIDEQALLREIYGGDPAPVSLGPIDDEALLREILGEDLAPSPNSCIDPALLELPAPPPPNSCTDPAPTSLGPIDEEALIRELLGEDLAPPPNSCIDPALLELPAPPLPDFCIDPALLQIPVAVHDLSSLPLEPIDEALIEEALAEDPATFDYYIDPELLAAFPFEGLAASDPVPSNEPANATIGRPEELAPTGAPDKAVSDDLNISLGSLYQEPGEEPAVGPNPSNQASTSAAEKTAVAIPTSVGPPCDLNASSGGLQEAVVKPPTTEVDRPAQPSTSADSVAAPAATKFELPDWANEQRSRHSSSDSDSDEGETAQPIPTDDETEAFAPLPVEQVSDEVVSTLTSQFEDSLVIYEDDPMDLDPQFSDSKDQRPTSASGEVFVSSFVVAPVPPEVLATTPTQGLENQYQLPEEATRQVAMEIEKLKEQYRQELDEARKRLYEELKERSDAKLRKYKAEFKEKHLRTTQGVQEHAEKVQAELLEVQQKIAKIAEVQEHADETQTKYDELCQKLAEHEYTLSEQQHLITVKDTILKEKHHQFAAQKAELERNARLLQSKDGILETSRGECVKYSEELRQFRNEADLVEHNLRLKISRLQDSDVNKKIVADQNAEIRNLKDTIEQTSESRQTLESMQGDIKVAELELEKLKEERKGLNSDLTKLKDELKTKRNTSKELEKENRRWRKMVTDSKGNAELLVVKAGELMERHGLKVPEEASTRKNGGKDNGENVRATMGEDIDWMVERDLDLGPIPPSWFPDEVPDKATEVKESVFPIWWGFALILLAFIGGLAVASWAWEGEPLVVDPWKMSVWSYHAGEGCGLSVPGWLWSDPYLELSGNTYG